MIFGAFVYYDFAVKIRVFLGDELHADTRVLEMLDFQWQSGGDMKHSLWYHNIFFQ